MLTTIQYTVTGFEPTTTQLLVLSHGSSPNLYQLMFQIITRKADVFDFRPVAVILVSQPVVTFQQSWFGLPLLRLTDIKSNLIITMWRGSNLGNRTTIPLYCFRDLQCVWQRWVRRRITTRRRTTTRKRMEIYRIQRIFLIRWVFLFYSI